jgi:hypothetical protein
MSCASDLRHLSQLDLSITKGLFRIRVQNLFFASHRASSFAEPRMFSPGVTGNQEGDMMSDLTPPNRFLLIGKFSFVVLLRMGRLLVRFAHKDAFSSCKKRLCTT